MTKRFGRNQRRQAREQIALADIQMRLAQGEAAAARREAHSAIERAMHVFMTREDRVHDAAMLVAKEIGKQVGEKLKPYAEQLYREMERSSSGPLVQIYATQGFERECIVVSGEIKSNFNIVVM